MVINKIIEDDLLVQLWPSFFLQKISKKIFLYNDIDKIIRPCCGCFVFRHEWVKVILCPLSASRTSRQEVGTLGEAFFPRSGFVDLVVRVKSGWWMGVGDKAQGH